MPEVKLQPGSQQERCWRSFQQMLRKRSLIASRDLRGGFSTLLLPVLAIALVLLVLKVNINPTAPTMVLSLSALPQVSFHKITTLFPASFSVLQGMCKQTPECSLTDQLNPRQQSGYELVAVGFA